MVGWNQKKREKDFEIAPDEIFLDSANVSDFDRDRFEGRLERPLARSAFWVLGSTLAFILLVLLFQVANLQIRQGSVYAEASAKNSLEERVLFAERGVISDRNGVPLVTNEATKDGFARREYKTPGFGALLGYVSYPRKDAKGIYYSTEISGLAGVEASFDPELKGEGGRLLVETDALGEVKSQGMVVPSVPGKSLTLSIDLRAQEAFYKAIRGLAESIPYAGGAGILMDVETGELHALVSYPEYDPNVLSSGGPKNMIENYNRDVRKPYLNRPVQGLYAPGSVVKPLVAAGALTDGIITPEYTVNALGSLVLPNPYNPDKPNVFPDWKVFGLTDLRKAIAWSSDVYFYIVGGGFGDKKGLGIDRLAHWYSAFGLTDPTGITLPGEEIGFVPTPEWKEETYDERWNVGNTYHTAIGQYAMQVTALQMARAIAAVANGGVLVTPTILKETGSRPKGTPQGTKVSVTKEALQVVREGMRQGVKDGTSSGLLGFEYLVHLAGKTGTAQTGTRNEFHNSWAVGFFPYENPRYVYTVVMEKGPAKNTIGGVYIMSQVLAELSQTAPEYFK